MFKAIRKFLTATDGAVTTDWVVLTAGVIVTVILGLALVKTALIEGIITIFSWVAAAGI